jgi:hypothetical protein
MNFNLILERNKHPVRKLYYKWKLQRRMDIRCRRLLQCCSLDYRMHRLG